MTRAKPVVPEARLHHAVPEARSVTPKIRCAIYTRKSSEEGLEMEFNSLDAQRESCESFIASQKAEGWVLVPDRYDDGGISGGTLERPALKRLLSDIEAGKVNCVVVYKIDRLTRSLTDFAKLVEVFDRMQTSFVSITQQFNTTTSMGRLTLNILLSFAQFERDVIGERIRDKFLASRRKGMWMGGVPPLGYDVRDRHLLVNDTEAILVRNLFQRFVDLGSATAVIKDLNADGFTTKSWTTTNGTERQGKPFDKGAFYKIVHNRTYLGEAVHKGTSYPGEHEAIVGQDLWDRAHALLADNGRVRANQARTRTPAPLQGILRCAHCGGAMTPTHTRRRGRLYRYYLCSKASKSGHDTCPVRAVAAGEIETMVVGQMRRLLKAPEIRARVQREADTDAATIAEALDRLDAIWDELFPAEQARLVRLLVEQVDVSPEGADLRLHAAGIKTVVVQVARPRRDAEIATAPAPPKRRKA